MGKPVGVIASGIVAILGSLVTLLIGAFMLVVPSIETSQPELPHSDSIAIASAVMCAVLGGLGLWTSVGIFRLRSWARTSILVFAGFLAAGSVFNLLVTMVVPIPEFSGGTGPNVRGVVALMFGIPLAIAVWWLIQFNTLSTKAAFATTAAETPSPRPLSITIIAWLAIVGGASSVLGILTDWPLFLFGAIFKGWTAAVIYVLLGALSLFIGKGLLDLREQARILAIGWVGFWSFHTAVVALVPTLRTRLFEMQRLEMQRQVVSNQPDPIPFDPTMLMNVMSVIGVIAAATAIWLLIRNRYAFVQRTAITGS